MRRCSKVMAALLLLAGALGGVRFAAAAEGPPIGAWRTTNQCFLAIFVLSENGRAQAAYLSGERDENASWSWDGTVLTITSASFPLDRFSGRLTSDGIDADYTWHDLDRDEFHRQTCFFERVTPPGLKAARFERDTLSGTDNLLGATR